MKLHVILTGATGMVGEGVLIEALAQPDVERVLILTRRPSGMSHPKLKEILVSDFYDLSNIESQLAGYNACFFCLGVSSIGMKEDAYRRVTYDLTMSVARTLSKLNSGMTFCYISGKATDSSEQGRMMWARVKGKTENDLMKLPFRRVFAFRPGMLRATKVMKNTLKYYKYVAWLYPALRFLYPSGVSTLKELGLAMIHVSARGYDKPVLEVNDIVAAAREELRIIPSMLRP
ncbi:MAG TPA: epimerase [Candidatus Kapabacteria bacterium]|nr:epimerase [Candidatus Kapabacteria bacterium]